ncbi:Dissimilatory sulfite reductase D (DsrD) [Desulfacinum hydrothermale DSM 13146]|uniref:Dissimilatory sulfite reductase D (DsrD) n=1 Tax=Desulfacinum hydrothermale DSM 13146 TaxID=1121390 RepID=A0A1W1XBH9_9BACT|nr:dissimilatory sulfite reductase D family protein [Desulfacinum hydrothermale]SMC21134.1 Dissimilatory sulfite reductase D (DsrD) [Desulfacinum hydrothermale DSM 13146]
MSQEAKEKILEYMKTQKKSKLYFNDLCKAVPDLKMRQAKKIINELVEEGKIKYWSSGSTTMYMLPGEDDVAKEEDSMK